MNFIKPAKSVKYISFLLFTFLSCQVYANTYEACIGRPILINDLEANKKYYPIGLDINYKKPHYGYFNYNMEIQGLNDTLIGYKPSHVQFLSGQNTAGHIYFTWRNVIKRIDSSKPIVSLKITYADNPDMVSYQPIECVKVTIVAVD